MLDLDTSRLPGRPAEWQALLAAIHEAAPNDEQQWLEWKSCIDLSSRDDVGTILAKAILAMSNRDPDEAVRCVGGYGIVVIGVEPAAVHGVTPVDNADLDALVARYIGDDGPRWQPYWDKFHGKNVLIVHVEPPKWGDPVHTLRRDAGKYRDGDVFVRRLARSDKAKSVDITRLTARAARCQDQQGPAIRVEVNNPRPLSKYTWLPEQLERFVEVERNELLQPLREWQASQASKQGGDVAAWTLPAQTSIQDILKNLDPPPRLGAALTRKVHETRRPEQYVTEVDEYLATLRTVWPQTMRRVAPYFIPPAVFTVKNLTDQNYRQLQVQAYVAGEADAAEHESNLDDLDLWRLLPKPPRAWGPYTESLVGRVPLPSTFVPRSSPRSVGPRTQIERGGSFMLKFAPVDLRPGESSRVLEDDWSILIPASRTEAVVVEWLATATNVDGRASGSIEVAFEGPAINVFEAAIQAPPADE